jgi:hypothetical protein
MLVQNCEEEAETKKNSSLCAEWYIDSFSNAVDRAPTVLRLAAAVAIEASR